MIGCPDCSLFLTGPSQNWHLLEHRTLAHRATDYPAGGYPAPDPGGPDVTVPADWLADLGGRDQ